VTRKSLASTAGIRTIYTKRPVRSRDETFYSTETIWRSCRRAHGRCTDSVSPPIITTIAGVSIRPFRGPLRAAVLFKGSMWPSPLI